MPTVTSPYELYSVTDLTAKKIIMRALRLLGAIPTGEEIAASELEDGRDALNHMLDSWNTEGLVVNTLATAPFALIAGQADYEIGADGDFDTIRPTKLEQGQVWLNADGTDRMLNPLTREEWNAIPDKSTSGTPKYYWYNRAFPKGEIWFYPKPNAADTITFYIPFLLNQITRAQSVSDSVFALPPGYAEAVIYGLAIRLAPEYGKPASMEILEIANNAKANLKRLNSEPQTVAVDDALLDRGVYDINSGDIF